MTGKSRPFRLKYTAVASALSAATILIPSVHAQGRVPAPIKYSGQGSYHPNSTSLGQSVGAPIRFASTPYQVASSGIPVYAQPANSKPESARTKRIEFRYPDEPGIVRNSNGTKTVEAAPRAQQHAAIGAPARITPPSNHSPVLDQPKYKQPIIEEVSMGDLHKAEAAPSISLEQGASTIQPVVLPGFDERGVASWYGDEFHGQPTANGEIFDMTALTAAHPTLPLPSLVQVTNLANNREVVLRVNDRGPFEPNRMIDVSKRAADELGFLAEREANVSVRYLGPAPVLPQQAAGQGTKPVAQSDYEKPVSEPAKDPQPYAQISMEPIPNPTFEEFFVQAGSFSQMENAERLSRDLGQSLPVDVVLANVNGSDYFRVMVGPYNNRAEASVMRDQLASSAIVDGVVIKTQ